MNFETSCWDCPVAWSYVLTLYAILTALAAVAGAMMGARRQFLRGLGWMAMVLIVFWSIIYTIVIPRWGIGSLDVPLDTWPRRSSWLILAMLDVAVIAVAAVARRISGRRHPTIMEEAQTLERGSGERR